MNPEIQDKVRDKVNSINEKTILDQPIDYQHLVNYLIWKWPGLDLNERVERLFLQNVNKSKYKNIRDVDKSVKQAKEFLDSYSDEHPELFKSGIDYVTKAFGLLDREFFSKHGFSRQTKNAITRFSEE